jgi:hypothetical protein
MSRFHVLHSRTLFRRYRGRPVPYTCFALPNSFSSVPVASIPVFMISAPEPVYDGTEGVASHLHDLLLDAFSTVLLAPGHVFMFCAPEGAVYRFHVLHFQTRFRRYRRCRVPFSCFALPDSFSTLPRASSPDYMFCAPGLVFGGSEGVVSSFLFWHSQSRFRRYRGRRDPFSCFALPNSFSTVSRSSCPVFEFCGNRGRRVPVSSLALSDPIRVEPRAPSPIFDVPR